MSQIKAAEKVLSELKTQRANHESRGTELAAERRRLSFAAVSGNETARKKLDTLNGQSAIHQVELENLAAAIDEATKRLEAARHDEATKADRLKAKRLREELLPALTEHCEKLDEALVTLVAHIEGATDVVRELNAAGAGPIERLFLLNGVKVVNAAMWRTPWRQEFTPIPPGQRKVFRELLEANWALGIRRRIAELDGAESKTAAAKAA
jgi:hypothetical protein